MKRESASFLGDLRLSRQLHSVGQVAAVGLIISMGLAFLIPGRVLTARAPASMTPIIIAAILLTLTLLNVLELLGGSNERGGSYSLVHETLGGPAGFFAGWALLGGTLAVALALFSASSEALGALFPALAPYGRFIAFGLLLALIVIEIFNWLPRRQMLWPATILLLLLFIAAALRPLWESGDAVPFSPGASSMAASLRSAAWWSSAYLAMEAILSARRWVERRGRRLEAGLIAALLGGVTVFVLALLIARRGAMPAVISGLEEGWLPPRVSTGAAFLTLMLASGGALIAAARQCSTLARLGALPGILNRVRRPFRLPPRIFLLLTLLSAAPLLLLPAATLLDIGAGLLLVAIIWINAAAFISRTSEPERRRPFLVPFFPLAPLLALGLSLGLFLALPLQAILTAAGWLLMGSVLLAVYAREHLLEAQHGVLVFGREPLPEKPEGVYRILVPISPGIQRQLTLQLANALAKQSGGEVIPLQVIPIADPLAIQEGRRLAEERNTLFQWSTREAARWDVSTYPITRLATSVPKGIYDTAVEEDIDLILMPWTTGGAGQGARMGHVLDPVVRQAPCDVAVLAHDAGEAPADKAQEVPFEVRRVLVPTAGGPHAPLATRLALLLAREYAATVSVVYVARPEASEAELDQGEARIEATLTAMREQMESLPPIEGKSAPERIPIETRVVRSPSVVDGIVKAGAESSLLFIGASEESLIDQVLFGTLPEQVARASSAPVVMVKSYRGLPRFWLQRLWGSLFQALPTLSRQDRIDVYKRIRRDARPDVDYFIMMGLSAMIATYGLLEGSSAVIIGAMLVAPLFTPILAFSLAIAQGDARLLRLALESALKGIALAIGVALLLTALSPLRPLTAEVTNRTSPNLFDLAIALASGAAGAYAIARKDVAASLPGVAVAAALVPPLCVIGVGLAMAQAPIAWGGTLLFTTNLIAITLAGAITLLLLGFRPTEGEGGAARLRVGLMSTVLLLIIISIPLGLVFARSARHSRMQRTIDGTLRAALAQEPALELEDFTFKVVPSGVQIEATLNAGGEVPPDLADVLRPSLASALRQPIDLTLRVVPLMELHSGGEGP